MNQIDARQIPGGVRAILRQLNNQGFAAYIVGGCVRDLLMGRPPHDWDITTNARPEQVMACFQNCRVVATGLKHGTVTVVYRDTPYEITTYRIDGAYTDNRHPDSVRFADKLVEDLARRDFCMNAIAAGIDGRLQDPFNGQEDIKRGLIRTVGNADDRFQEDGLRILRALRFAAKLGFALEGATGQAILRNKALLHNIAYERIAKEFAGILQGDNAAQVLREYRQVIAVFIPEIAAAFDFAQHNPYHQYDVYEHIIQSVQYAQGDLVVKLTMFFHDIGKPQCFVLDDKGVGHFYGHARESYHIAQRVLQRLRFDNKTQENVVQLVKYHDLVLQPKARFVLRMLNKMGEEQFRRLLKVHEADAAAQSPLGLAEQRELLASTSALLAKVLTEQRAFKIADLAINGRDVIGLGVQPGPEIGRLLKLALAAVMEGRQNEREELLKFLRENISASPGSVKE